MTSSTTPKLTHVWQEVGMGIAPYRCTGVTDTGSISTTCDACGAGLRYVYHVRDGRGDNYKVGCDCIGRVSDSRLTTEAKQAKAKLDREKKRAAAEARRQAWVAKRDAELERQRLANGGKTDEELRHAAQVAAHEQRLRDENEWLIEAFDLRGRRDRQWQGLYDLLSSPITGKSPKYVSIVAECYAKLAGRGNSKAYQAALEAFWDKLKSFGYQAR